MVLIERITFCFQVLSPTTIATGRYYCGRRSTGLVPRRETSSRTRVEYCSAYWGSSNVPFVWPVQIQGVAMVKFNFLIIEERVGENYQNKYSVGRYHPTWAFRFEGWVSRCTLRLRPHVSRQRAFTLWGLLTCVLHKKFKNSKHC